MESESIAGIPVSGAAVTQAISLSRGEGYERREHGERQQLLGEEHISVVLRVGGTGGEERGCKCLLD